MVDRRAGVQGAGEVGIASIAIHSEMETNAERPGDELVRHAARNQSAEGIRAAKRCPEPATAGPCPRWKRTWIAWSELVEWKAIIRPAHPLTQSSRRRRHRCHHRFGLQRPIVSMSPAAIFAPSSFKTHYHRGDRPHRACGCVSAEFEQVNHLLAASVRGAVPGHSFPASAVPPGVARCIKVGTPVARHRARWFRWLTSSS